MESPKDGQQLLPANLKAVQVRQLQMPQVVIKELLGDPFLFLPGLRFKTYVSDVVPPIKLIIVQ